MKHEITSKTETFSTHDQGHFETNLEPHAFLEVLGAWKNELRGTLKVLGDQIMD